MKLSLINLSCSSDSAADKNISTDNQTIKSINVAESLKLIEKNKSESNFVILDIRTAQEYNSGHLENAVNIDFYKTDFAQKLNKLDKNKSYLIYCRTANRTGHALLTMQKLGFNEVYNMLGGIVQWNMQGLPVIH